MRAGSSEPASRQNPCARPQVRILTCLKDYDDLVSLVEVIELPRLRSLPT